MQIDQLTPPPRPKREHRLYVRLHRETAAALAEAAALRRCRPAELARRVLELALEPEAVK